MQQGVLDTVLVASEPLDYSEDWRLVPKQTLLTIYPAGGASRVARAQTTQSPVPPVAGGASAGAGCRQVQTLADVPMVVEERRIDLMAP